MCIDKCPSQPAPEQPPATAGQNERINPSINPSEPLPRATVDLTDDAGGVAKNGKSRGDDTADQRQWYVVYVSPRAEKKVCKSLLDASFEAYSPTRREIHHWRNGQHKKVEVTLISGVVFVKIASNQLDRIRPFPYVYSFMMDPAKRNNPNGFKSFAIIPDNQMRLLKAMVGQAEYDVNFTTTFTLGEYVRVAGFDTNDDLAQIVELPGDKKPYVGVRVGFLGCAYMKVPTARIIKVKS